MISKVKSPGSSNEKRLSMLANLLLFVLTFLIYLRTLAPGVYGFDSAEFATGVYSQGIIHPPGFPLYLLIGKLFTYLPFRDVAYRLNLMSAVFASITVMVLYNVAINIVDNRLSAWVAALLLSVSNYFWQMALVAEVYTLFTALVIIDVLIVQLWHKTGSKRFLLAFSFLYGITLTSHTSGILFAPAFAWLIIMSPSWHRTCWKWVVLMFLLFIAGLSLYVYLPIRASAHPLIDYTQFYPGIDISTISGFWWLISGKAYLSFAFGYSWPELPAEILRFANYLWRNFFGIGVVFGLVGFISLCRKNIIFAVGVFFMFLANIVFFINYRVMDKDTMFLPAYLIWTIFIAVGLELIEKKIDHLVSSMKFRVCYKKLTAALQILLVIMCLCLNWRWVDMSQATGYSSFAKALLADAAPDSIIIAPWSSAVVLEYYQVVEGARPDLRIINRSRLDVAKYYGFWVQGLQHTEIMERLSLETKTFIEQEIQQKNIYAVEYDPVLAKNFEYLPEGAVFRLAGFD
jgi:hypothetical protein